MRYLMFLMALLVTGTAQAMNCQELPDCESLGYSKDGDPNCAENGYMFCPFDQDYKVCVQYNCEALGFTESDKTSWCADLIKCKGNEKMTLCQKPCFATDAQSLAELASSGKCKIVTMRNDITIPENQDITLAKNTTLDGNGHTITATYTSFTLLDGAKLKNLNIQRKINSVEELTLISVQGHGFFEDISVLEENNNTVQTEKWRYLCRGSGTLTLSGALKFEVKNDVMHPVFNIPTILENANIEIISPQKSSDAFWANNKGVARNSEIYIKAGDGSLAILGDFNFINSKVIIESAYALTWTVGNDESSFTLSEGGYFDTKQNDLVHGGGRLKFIFNGTADKPATLVIGKEHKGDDVTLEVQNTAATLLYNGVTYHPRQVCATPLSDIPNSPDWEHQ